VGGEVRGALGAAARGHDRVTGELAKGAVDCCRVLDREERDRRERGKSESECMI